MDIVASTDHARAILRRLDPDWRPDRALPVAVAEVVRRCASSPCMGDVPTRVDSRDGRFAAYVKPLRVSPPAPIATVLRLFDDRGHEAELNELLHRRYHMTPRELQLISQLRLGKSNKQIATALGLTEGTVKVYLHRIFETLHVESRTELVGLVDRLS